MIEEIRNMNALFLSQLKNMPWVYNDIIVDVDGEALTVATLIERYKQLRNATESASASIESMIKAKTKKTKTKTEK